MTRRTYEAAERRMWRDAFCAVYPAESAKRAGEQADDALEQFRKRYPAPQPEPAGSSDSNPPQEWESTRSILCEALSEIATLAHDYPGDAFWYMQKLAREALAHAPFKGHQKDGDERTGGEHAR